MHRRYSQAIAAVFLVSAPEEPRAILMSKATREKLNKGHTVSEEVSCSRDLTADSIKTMLPVVVCSGRKHI
jgi:hypothetical protein